MFRSAILVILGTSITAFISFFVVVSYRLFPRGEYTTHRVSVLWAKIMLRISSVRVTVEGREHILRGRAQVFMANHQSGFDILIVLANIDTYFAWIAKKELFGIPVFGHALAKTGSIAIDRKNFVRAMRSIHDAARRIREGKSVMTFPEGTRSMDGQIHPFKKGVFHLALKAGVPIVPVALKTDAWGLGRRLKDFGPIRPAKTVHIHFGEPMEVKGSGKEEHALVVEFIERNLAAWRQAAGLRHP